jgi:hypothetical protein
MPTRERTIGIVVSLTGLVLFLLIQIVSWRNDRRLNPGAFLLLIFIIGPLFARGRDRSS